MIRIVLFIIMFISIAWAEPELEIYYKNKKSVVLVGKLRNEGFPLQLTLNFDNYNAENIFVTKLPYEDAIKYNNVPVVVEGKIDLYQRQYMMTVEKIRIAKPNEFQKVKLNEF